jgi:hypothetical protein
MMRRTCLIVLADNRHGVERRRLRREPAAAIALNADCSEHDFRFGE